MGQLEDQHPSPPAFAAVSGTVRDVPTDAFDNTAYRFVSDRATDARATYGVTSISLLAHRR